MSGASVVAVIAPNGLGHLRRASGILDRLLEMVPVRRVTLVCAAWQIDALAGAPALDRLLGRVEVVDGATEPGVAWSTDPGTFDDGRLFEWEERLAATGVLDDVDVVLSDNLAGVLAHRPDAVLLGSFLWSDVLEPAARRSVAVRRFIERERALLTACRPPMLCVADLVMPGVLGRTAAVPVGWMCDRTFRRGVAAPPGGAVAVLGGRTGALDAQLAAAVLDLLAAGRTVVAAERVRRELPAAAQPSVGRFHHRPADYLASEVILCRPGVGTMTDCVAAEVPAVFLHDGTNAELSHNARRAEALGIGIEVGPGGDVLTAVERLSGDAGAAARRKLRSLDMDGIDAAARWLAERVGADALVGNGTGEVQR